MTLANASNDPLRKAAILVAALDTSGADALLAQLEPEQAAVVRRLTAELAAVDPAEQRAVIDEFLGRSAQPPSLSTSVDDGGVELDPDLVRRLAADDASTVPSAGGSIFAGGAFGERNSGSPFQFLEQAESEALVRKLRNEQPQTIAIVVSHLPHEQAAQFVAALPEAVQGEVLRRLAHLDEADPESIRAVEESLASWLTDHLRHCRQRQAGLSTVAGILRASQPAQQQVLLGSLKKCDGRLAARLAPERSERPRAVSAPAPSSANPGGTARFDRLRFLDARRREAREAHEAHEAHASPPSGAAQAVAAAWDSPPTAPVGPAHVDLPQLDDRELLAVLAAADPEVVVLALAGAASEFVERALRVVPAPVGEALRRQLGSLRMTKLSDMAAAHQELAALAREVLRQRRGAELRQPRLSMAV